MKEDLRVMKDNGILFMPTEVNMLLDIFKTKTVEEIKKEYEETYPESTYFIIDKNSLDEEEIKHYYFRD